GNDASGLASGGSGSGGGGFGGSGGHGSKFGYYAGQVKGRVLDALRANKKTRSAVMDVQVRVWVDDSGHVTKVSLSKSTGNPDLDAALKSEVFNEISMSEPPPAGMPMPIVMHFSAKRPG
ncbi:MAG: TonB C-terminal domain-containing protein, partial [Verrucomicrobia bacterium]